MAIFYLVRHGATNYAEQNTKIYQGYGINLAPLSNEGILEIKNTSKDSRLYGADIILSSPYTRALQTAAILSKELNVDIAVETDLHEWIANKNYVFVSDSIAEVSYTEFNEFKGMYPNNQEKDWEDIEALKQRITSVLKRYENYDKVIVVCHSMIISSLCGARIKNGEIVEIKIKD